MNDQWSEGFDAGVSWYKHYLEENQMNQHDPKHYYHPRTDPFKQGYWDKEITDWTDVIISTICIVVALVAIGSVLFLS